MIIIALSRSEEIAQIAFGRKPRRLIGRRLWCRSIRTESFDSHPAHNEPPEMLSTRSMLSPGLISESRMHHHHHNTHDPAIGCRSRNTAALSANVSNLCVLTTSLASRPAVRLAIVHIRGRRRNHRHSRCHYVVHQDGQGFGAAIRDPTVASCRRPQITRWRPQRHA